MKKSAARQSAPLRDTYRHGDLYRALLDAGIQLATEGGPQAVVLREATRRAGVAPNAAYRHFESRQALLEAVRKAGLAAVARSMEAQLAAIPPGKDAKAAASDALRAVGRGYMRFAREHSGLFRAAFAPPEPVEEVSPDPAKAGDSGLNPFQLLGAAIDRMQEAGLMPPERRPGAEFLAWSAVHGLALLVIDGPLRNLPAARIDALGERLLDMVEKGL
ncbi:TetR/AcrR family transcriptional regulator [Variovorax dokdonensis]|uniref:TetR/AcrR family transcriptional regulator n=1 Tax=Variovorax dokdonensis TaxID=344883 RepID=A0ABT7NBI7_9BURK|nr:TetR/AcrR family transcriptional regulator [Variovorax dokdonensis]MDM0045230.1 TetR/AcrR family transcriptional regulator [Variovorax dokdonensis]